VDAEDLDKDQTHVSSHAEALGGALEEAGEPSPGNNYEPHHIVAANDPRAAPAREVLEKAGIPVDDWQNGVWLPRAGKEPAATTTDAFTDHGGVHTNAYYEYVNNKLVEAGQDNAHRALTELYFELKNGLMSR